MERTKDYNASGRCPQRSESRARAASFSGGEFDARLRAFPAQPVVGVAFMPGLIRLTQYDLTGSAGQSRLRGSCPLRGGS
jgi:hypothetical protein